MESANYICHCGRGSWAKPGMPRECPQCGVVITLAMKQKEQVMDETDQVNGAGTEGAEAAKSAKVKKAKAPAKVKKAKAPAKPKKEKAAKAPKVAKAKPAPKAKADKPAKAGGRPKRSSLFPVEHRITMLADSDGKRYGASNNPKQKGSMAATRFAFYRDGMTVKSFLEKGGQVADLSNDTLKKFIKVAPAPAKVGAAEGAGADATA